MTSPDVVQALDDLAAAFPRHEFPPRSRVEYARRLADLPPAAVCAAVERAILTATFPPSIGEIRAVVAELALGDAVQPETAWAEVMREVRRVGHNRPPTFANGRFLPPEAPTFSDPRIAEAVDATGWAYLCTGEPMGVVKGQFERTLRAVCERATRRVQNGRLPDGTPLPSGDEGGEPLRMIPGGRESA